MAQDIPVELQTAVNRQVLDYVADESAHSDIVDVFKAALKPLGDVRLFCPDWQAYRVVIVSTQKVIFAFAIGMSEIAFRLDSTLKPRALLSGAEPLPACGPDWVSFTLFRSDWPKPDLEFWAGKAYTAARER